MSIGLKCVMNKFDTLSGFLHGNLLGFWVVSVWNSKDRFWRKWDEEDVRNLVVKIDFERRNFLIQKRKNRILLLGIQRMKNVVFKEKAIFLTCMNERDEKDVGKMIHENVRKNKTVMEGVNELRKEY